MGPPGHLSYTFYLVAITKRGIVGARLRVRPNRADTWVRPYKKLAFVCDLVSGV
jgi:hypothetical protein